MDKSVAFVQLCRSGDIVLALPMMLKKHKEGFRVFCVVHKEFAAILDAVSYVTPLVFDGLHRDIAGAIALAKQYADQVIVTQAPNLTCDMVSGQVKEYATGIPVESKTFVERLWRAGGMWDKFHQLPLVLDKRDARREAEIRGAMIPPGRKPLLVYSLQGYSSYFAQSQELQTWIAETFSDRWRLLNLTYDPILNRGTRLNRITDLLPLIESADVLITTNSLPLHLAYAFGTKTISIEPSCSPDDLTGDPTYWRSEPRPHWIGRVSHKEAATGSGRKTIESILEKYGSPTRKSHPHHASVVS